ncbi:MAG TPA: hypothetical protein VK132_10785, partial [Gemmatimonadales bacterium]|nr:hypothetical protein [Gemmatimonadales bacterium]
TAAADLVEFPALERVLEVARAWQVPPHGARVQDIDGGDGAAGDMPGQGGGELRGAGRLPADGARMQDPDGVYGPAHDMVFKAAANRLDLG